MPRILLAEDLADQRNLYHDVLTDAGYEVFDAESGPQALELFKKHKPDIVVLDIQMPGMDGIEMLGRMLAKDKRVPVILYSAYPAYKANFMTWAADGFVVKTGDATELLTEIRRISKERGIEVPDTASLPVREK